MTAVRAGMCAPGRSERTEAPAAWCLVPLALALLAGCGGRPPPEPAPSPRPAASYHFDRLVVLPLLSLGDLDRVRPPARRSLALAFSARTDSLILLEEEEDEAHGTGEAGGDRPVPVDSLYTTRCDFGLVRERLPAERRKELEVDGLHALCADLGYRRRPPDADTLQVATAVGRIWSGRRDSVIWHDSVSVTVRLDRSRLSPDTIASLLTEAVLRLRDRLP